MFLPLFVFILILCVLYNIYKDNGKDDERVLLEETSDSESSDDEEYLEEKVKVE